MKRISVLVFFLLCLTPLFAQDMVEIFGYYESQIMGAEIKGDFNHVYANKLRVDLKSSLSDNITFAANFDYITYHGKTSWNILDFLAPGITDSVPQEMEQDYTIPFLDRNFLDNAYLKMAFRHFDLIVGKQQVSLGTGYVWNPTDVFNIKDPLDPTYEQPGHNAIRLDVPLGSAYTFTTLYSPEDTWKNSDKLIQLKGRISHFDYSLIAIEKLWRFHDYTIPIIKNMSFIGFLEQPEKRQLLGASTEGELLGLGVWAEYGFSKMENSEDFYELVVGTNYTFDFQTFVMVEYYRNTLGKTDYQQYDLNDWMRSFAAEQKAISQDQIYILVQHPVMDFLSLGLSSIYSISDKSLAFVPMLSYSLSENVDIMAYVNYNFGKEGTAFSKSTGNGGLLRARVYF